MTAAIVDSLVAAWNSTDVDRIAGLYADDAVVHHPMSPSTLKGRGEIREMEGTIFPSFSEVRWTAGRVLTDGPTVALEFNVSAVNTGDLQTPNGPVPATNRPISVDGSSFLHLSDDGRIAEEHRYFNVAAMLAQLGLQ